MSLPPEIHQIHPHSSAPPLDDDQLLRLYASSDPARTALRANVVASVDGSSTFNGLSGALGGPADKRVFDLLRRLADVIVIGAGTLRSEGYGAMRLDETASRWRVEHGLAAQPHLAIVSARLDLDPESDVFARAPVRPIVLTVERADRDGRRALERVAEVSTCGEAAAGGKEMLEALTSRGLTALHCEGGPRLLGTFIGDDLLDELCLTTSPLLEGGAGPRISAGGSASVFLPMTLDHVLISKGVLFSKYSRMREGRGDDAASAD